MKKTENIIQYRKDYYSNHKNELLTKKKYCPICEREYKYINFSHHEKTGKHLKNIDKKQVPEKEE
jgi:hypothetical protein